MKVQAKISLDTFLGDVLRLNPYLNFFLKVLKMIQLYCSLKGSTLQLELWLYTLSTDYVLKQILAF